MTTRTVHRVKSLFQSRATIASARLTPVELIVSLIALLKSGVSLHQACADISHHPSASVTLDSYMLTSLVTSTVSPRHFHHYMTKESFINQLYAVCKLSEIAGSSTVQCLEILHEDIRRHEKRSQRKADATAVARMTIRVLLALPLFTLVVSSMTGVDSLMFLISSAVGWVCAGVAVVLYICGLVWMRALLSRFEKATRSSLQRVSEHSKKRGRR
ncbi:type II secretion system F family protein [Alloscardovia omnicolens]|uniref:type II secretion system F family protein n=1 Tax=Alloscardovia omnicolens TaxID=419015 RepID=UPI003A7ACCC5